MVGLIPLFATEVVDRRLLSRAPRFRNRLRMHKGGLFRGHYVCACPEWENDRGEHLLSIVDHTMLQPMLSRLLDEQQFLSPYGVRSVSKIHERERDLGVLPGVGMAMIEYVPGESTSALFGGNSNWRGPIWLPVNYMLIQAIEKFHRFLGEEFTFAVPCLDNQRLTLNGIANLDRRSGGQYLSPRRRRRRAGDADPIAVPRRPALARSSPVLRVLPRRDRPGAGRIAPDRMDRADRQSGVAPLPQGDSRLLEQPANS